MKKTLIFFGLVVVFLFFLAASAPSVSAADSVVGNGTPQSCTESAFNSALAGMGGGGTLTFNCGSNPHTIQVTSPKNLVNGIVVDGGGLITLSGGDAARIFTIDAQANVQIQHLTLADGSAAGGGAILSAGNMNAAYNALTLLDVTLVGNHSTGIGGAISAQYTDLIITNSTLQENTSNGAGAAINLYGGSLTMTETDVFTNTTLQGGASSGGLQLAYATFTIQTTELRGNTSTFSSGGAITLLNSTGDIIDSLFKNNTGYESFSYGGGLFASSASQVTLENVTLTGNRARNGGAVANEASTVILDGAILAENEAVSGGGGLYNYSGGNTAFSNGSIIQENEADYGGGIYNLSSSLLVLLDTSILENTGLLGGGGIYNIGTVQMERATLANNTGGDGGGLNNSGSSSMINVTIANNAANFGGGIFNNGTLDLVNVTIAGNDASQGGGGGLLSNNGSSVSLSMLNTLLTDNLGSSTANDQCLLYKAPDSLRYSLWEGTSCGSSTENNNLPNTDGRVIPLGFTGTGLLTELTMTQPIRFFSPAKNAGTCEDGTPETDQRGVLRPFDGQCDIGAVEIVYIEYTVYLPLVNNPGQENSR